MAKARHSAIILATLIAVCAAGCSSKPKAADAKNPFNPVYDKKTGKLTILKFDSKKDGKIDTWSYMDGTRIVRIEIDRDGDGKVDRWEYYGADQKVEKIGLSRANDGHGGRVGLPGSDGNVAKMEISTNRDGKVNRTEFYQAGVLSRVEEDTKGTGRIDKWETYRGRRVDNGGVRRPAARNAHPAPRLHGRRPRPGGGGPERQRAIHAGSTVADFQ